MLDDVDHDRRRFLGSAAMTIAAARLGMIGSANAQPSETAPADPSAVRPAANAWVGALRQVDAGVLNIGYAEAGPATGSAVAVVDVDAY